MKSLIKLDEFLPHLPAALADGVQEALKTAECQPELHRAVSVNNLTPQGERSFVGYASTRSIDRDEEIVMPGGMDLSQFRKAPVLLWGHKWSEPPVGEDDVIENDGYGLKTRSRLAATSLANDLWLLVKDHFLKTSSIGFIPLEYKMPGDKNWGMLMDSFAKWPEFDKNAPLRSVVTRALLLEHSLVSVPANSDALVTAVKRLGCSEALLKVIGEAPPKMHQKNPGGEIHDIDITQYRTAPVIPAVPPVKIYHRLVKTPEQVQVELDAEVRRLVNEELSRRMGRV